MRDVFANWHKVVTFPNADRRLMTGNVYHPVGGWRDWDGEWRRAHTRVLGEHAYCAIGHAPLWSAQRTVIGGE